MGSAGSDGARASPPTPSPSVIFLPRSNAKGQTTPLLKFRDTANMIATLCAHALCCPALALVASLFRLARRVGKGPLLRRAWDAFQFFVFTRTAQKTDPLRIQRR